MRKAILFVLLTAAITSCNEKKSASEELTIPKSPVSVAAVKEELKTKNYSVADAGMIDVFNANEFEWASASKDTTKFFKDYMEERKTFSLRFINDTAVQLTDDKKTLAANYDLEKDTSPAVILHIKYADSSFSFNPGEPMMMTYTYKIRGIDNSALLLETPREMNRRKIILLMKKM